MEHQTADISFTNLFGERLLPAHRPQLQVKVAPPPPPQKIVYTGLRVYIRPTCLVALPQFSGGSMVRSISQRANEVNLAQNKNNGKVSAKAASKISAAVNWLALAAKKKRVYHKATDKVYQFKLNLITLTLPETATPVSASFFKEELLQPFLSYMRKYAKLQNYIWKIEPQANNRVHLHLTADTFIYHQDLRRIWNNQLRRHGLLTDFQAKFGHDNPPTEQVKCVRSVKNMAAYMAKYMQKSELSIADCAAMLEHKSQLEIFAEEKEALLAKRENFLAIWQNCGRLWGCNYELSRANNCFVDAQAQDEYSVVGTLVNDLIRNKPILGQMQTNGFLKRIGDLWFVKASNWLRDISGPLKHMFENIIHYLRTHQPMQIDMPDSQCPVWCLS